MFVHIYTYTSSWLSNAFICSPLSQRVFPYYSSINISASPRRRDAPRTARPFPSHARWLAGRDRGPSSDPTAFPRPPWPASPVPFPCQPSRRPSSARAPCRDPSLYIHPESVNRFARGVPLGHFMVSKHPLKPSLSELPSPPFASSESIENHRYLE